MHQEGRLFTCPSCGASLTTEGDKAEITCNYCGQTVIVPEELRVKPSPPTSPRQSPQVYVVEPVIIETPGAVYNNYPRPQQRSPGRSGCGCGCGCRIITLLLITLIIGGAILYFTRPVLFSDLLSRIPGLSSVITSIPAQITLLTAQPTSVNSGGSVTIVRITNGEQVTLQRLENNRVIQSLNVNASDSHTFNLSGAARTIIFRLIIARGSTTDSRDIPVSVR